MIACMSLKTGSHSRYSSHPERQQLGLLARLEPGISLCLLWHTGDEAQSAVAGTAGIGVASKRTSQPHPAAEVLVVSSSPGARWLAEQVQAKQLTNVRLLDFQPAADFPSILEVPMFC